MSESMQGLKRSHRCTEVSAAQIGANVTVMGWVQKSRNKGGIIFVDLRDRSGILQIIFEESDCGAESFLKSFSSPLCSSIILRTAIAEPCALKTFSAFPASADKKRAKVYTEVKNVPPTSAQTVRSAASESLSSQKITVLLRFSSFFLTMFFSFSSAVESAAQLTALIII